MRGSETRKRVRKEEKGEGGREGRKVNSGWEGAERGGLRTAEQGSCGGTSQGWNCFSEEASMACFQT